MFNSKATAFCLTESSGQIIYSCFVQSCRVGDLALGKVIVPRVTATDFVAFD
jgi:hypothetical protein